MASKPIHVAIGRDYDRMRSLQSGEGPVVCSVLPSVHDAFQALATDPSFDAAEMSTGFYVAMSSQQTQPVIALPVFPSRSFRYGNLFVRRDSPLTRVEELRGGRVGLPEYGMTMGVWLRGIFSDVHGVQPREVEWITTHDPVLTEVPLSVEAAGISVSQLQSGNMWEALEEGRIDAAIGVPPMTNFATGSFRRLRVQYWEDDLAYFRSSGNFPIMHSLVVRRNILEDDPDLVEVLFRAFCEAKRKAVDDLVDSLATLSTTLPLLTAHVDQARAEFGENWWPYGFEENRGCIETLIRYSREQGVIDREMSAEELFHHHSLSLVDDVRRK